MTRALHGLWLGRRGYAEVYALQASLLAHRRSQAGVDVVLLLEHEATITAGKGFHADNLRATAEVLAARGVEYCATDRGGDITVHAPGQLVAYPIVELPPGQRDVRRYVKGLSEVMRALVARHGIDAGMIPEYIGLWADAESVTHWPGPEAVTRPVKLGAIGVRISRWVTMHGFALNYSTDLQLFDLIVPCGIRNLGVGSVEALRGSAPRLVDEAKVAHELLAERYGFALAPFRDCSQTGLGELERELLSSSGP
jgi:lipoyl(octanoyl) transferase